jgi:hypothetical protein
MRRQMRGRRRRGIFIGREFQVGFIRIGGMI